MTQSANLATDVPAAASTNAARVGRLDYLALTVITSFASLVSFLRFLAQDQVLVHGDAIAHIMIARRLFDSRTPGPLQLGTVWLPLPHLLSAPFLISNWAWRTGIGGSVVSMLAYVLGTVGIYRLVRRGLEHSGADASLARGCGWFAAFLYAANPSLIYLQATALTESLSLAFFIWTISGFSDFVFALRERDNRSARRSLRAVGWLLLAATLTRYDGWFASVILVVLVFVLVFFTRSGREVPRAALARFAVLAALGPALWLGYNAYVFKNPLEFATGPYSAKAIEERSRRPGEPHHPGWHSPYVASVYFVKSVRLIIGDWRYDRTWFPMALVGTALLLGFGRGLWPWLISWLPLPFYAISIAYGGVPLFIPTWWPFSYYNVRYGIQLLPALSIFFALTLYFGLAWIANRSLRAMVSGAAIGVVTASYAFCWMTVPICQREARVNTLAKNILERALAYDLAKLPRSSTLLMYTGEHGGALERAGIPLRRTINEGNWGVWQKALSAPSDYADYVVAGAGDPLSDALTPLPPEMDHLQVLHTPGQPDVTIYRIHRRP